ncbi:TlpA family protein disulfide reductase [Micromonospora sp. NBC_01796]|uniref:TlpA family protein disulfide reductase n=1 Tax=Micromonospora sp. NBC_01796 TaxID=2975987 RepID=UPI002DDABBBA|nr:redoxin domain-containing protein [Micromonospora sp. NBC_01796]WSA86447.1 TlpA family protein disulfide reductase [Micromonospora sp. NBC_01796]
MRRLRNRTALLPAMLVVAALALGACSGPASESAAGESSAPAAAGGADTLPGPVPAGLALRPAPSGAPAAPAFTGTLTDGSPLTIANFWAERPVVLVFFSSWCTVCAERQTALSDLARSYRDRVVFVGVVSEDEPADLEPYLREHKVEFPVVFDPAQTTWQSYAVREPGAVAVVAKGGALLRGWPGGLDASALDAQLRELVIAG